MKILPTSLPEAMVLVPARHGDARGYFSEVYQRERFAAQGIGLDFVQDNHAHNRDAGVVRGLHFQSPPKWQAKLVRVAHGRIFAVAVDLRPDSTNFGRHASATLTADQGEQLLVPLGFAFGYCTLEPGCDVLYKVSDYYAPQLDRGLAWDDPALGIAWPVAADKAILSDKDRRHPTLKNLPRDWLMTISGTRA